MDIKNVFDKYKVVIGVDTNLDNIKESIKIIENSNMEFDFRTTIVKEFHELKDISDICSMISKKSKYYIQNFVNSDGVLNKKLHSFTNEELVNMKKALNNKYQNIIFRDI